MDASLPVFTSSSSKFYFIQQLGGGWLGLTDTAIEGTWMWPDGGPSANYIPWGPNEPNEDPNEDCAAVKDGIIQSLLCSDTANVLCERG